MKILVLNCGSSSVKFAVIDPQDGTRPLEGIAERLGGSGTGRISWEAGDGRGDGTLSSPDHDAALAAITELLHRFEGLWDAIAGIGHRVVHGGERFTGSVLIDQAVLDQVEAVAHLAPLHNPPNLAGIKAARSSFPHLPQAAVFDTSFHQTMPARAYLYAVPRELYEEHGVRRYGFHGTSHRFVVAEAARLLERPLNETALVTAHLGNGASAAAVLGGRSMDTTMGLTPLEGLVMGTRSGNVDPGLHEFLVERLGSDIHQVTRLLNKQSGLLGLSGLSNDMRTLSEAAAAGDDNAALAREVFCYRLASALAALSVSLGRRPDALVFTGGIGEHDAGTRAQVVELLAPHWGFELDAARNDTHGAGSRGLITADGATVAMVVPTDEELLIATDTAALIRERGD